MFSAVASSGEESSECGPTFVTTPLRKNAGNTGQSSHYDLPVVRAYMVSLSDSSDEEIISCGPTLVTPKSHKVEQLGSSEKGKHVQRLSNKVMHTNVNKYIKENCDPDSDFEDYSSRVWRAKEKENVKPTAKCNEGGLETTIKKNQKMNEEHSSFVQYNGMQKGNGAAFRTWCRPYSCIEFVKRFFDNQIKVVQGMGFGGLLKLKMFQLKRKLIKLIVQKIDIDHDVLMLDNRPPVPIYFSDVADYFGVPAGKEIIRPAYVSIEDKVPSWNDIENQFINIGSGSEFRVWFLHMDACTILAPTSCNNGCNKLYKIIKTSLHKSPTSYNWAEFIYSRV